MNFDIFRAPTGTYKKTISRLPFHGINTFMLGRRASATEAPQFLSTPVAALSEMDLFLGSSDLWKKIKPAFGPCDGMVPGKYHQARAFAFETPHFYLWCHTETGSRGTGWFLADKSSSPMDTAQNYYTYFDFSNHTDALMEIVEALGQIGARCAMASPDLCHDLLCGSFIPNHIARIHARECQTQLVQHIPPRGRVPKNKPL